MGRKIVILFAVGCLFLITNVKAQALLWDTVFVANGPLCDGMVLFPAQGMSVCEGSDNLVEIRSRQGSIYNMQEGVVTRIFAVEGMLSVVIRSGEKEHYVYSNLATVCPSVGDTVKPGTHMGECLTNDEGWFVLELGLYRKDKFLTRMEMMEMLQE